MLRFNSFPFIFPISILMILLVQKASFADLRVCNRTGETVYVAIATLKAAHANSGN